MIDIWSNIRRRLYGLFAALGVLVLFDLLPAIVPFSQDRLLDYFYVWAGLGSGLMMGVSALVGAYVAKVRFVLPAVFLTVIWWPFVIWFLNSIAVAAGQGDLRTVAATNVFGLGFGVVGAIMGSLLGEQLATWRAGRVSNAA